MMEDCQTKNLTISDFPTYDKVDLIEYMQYLVNSNFYDIFNNVKFGFLC